ncbi:hypothetical protein [Ferroplasma sp.]|uniref:hypothetical protein n=1 Tax=Ferroplasma sp. TaxID=2591003 RepID=UPI00307EB884
MLYKSLAAVKENGVPADRACRIMPVIIATLAFAIFVHAVLTHIINNILIILNYF